MDLDGEFKVLYGLSDITIFFFWCCKNKLQLEVIVSGHSAATEAEVLPAESIFRQANAPAPPSLPHLPNSNHQSSHVVWICNGAGGQQVPSTFMP